MRRLDPAKILFWFSCVLVVFGYGVAVGRYKIFPYSALEFGKLSADRLLGEAAMRIGMRPTAFLSPARYEGNGVTRRNGQIAPGVTLLSGFFDRSNELRLIRQDGSVVNRWPVQFFDIFQTSSHIPVPGLVPRTNWNVELHGALALPDGSVLFNFEGAGLVKLDRCGAIQWKVPRMTHHSIEQAADGGFWVPGQRYVGENSPFPALAPPYLEETILRVSEDGRIVSELSVLELLFKNNLQALLFANGLEGLVLANDYENDNLPNDITHLNDIEELSRELSDRFPKFAPGDLLLSLRDLNLIMVVDPQSAKIKWYQTGPWMKQHDPDFQLNGRISVFSNNDDGTETGSILGGSHIIEVDPNTGETAVKYGKLSGQTMYSSIRGKHQNLQSGNILITESQAGRAFEVNSSGDIVWEFINRYGSAETALVTQAHRYPEDYFVVEDWTCK